MIDSTRAATADNFGFPGGKGAAGFAEWIISHFPPHVYYAEPFAGKAAVFRAKVAALRTYLIDADLEVIRWHRRRRAAATVCHLGDGIRWLELAGQWAPPDLLVYCDPPYLPATRTPRRLYRRELSHEDHERILAALRRLPCPVAISGYPSELYAERLEGWTFRTREQMTRGGYPKTEGLWFNYDPALQPPDYTPAYSDLGGDYRERERVARRLRRWSARLAGLQGVERRALLLALLEADHRGRGR